MCTDHQHDLFCDLWVSCFVDFADLKLCGFGER